LRRGPEQTQTDVLAEERLMIAVTGATGQLGQLVMAGLLKSVQPQSVIAAVRNPAKARSAEFTFDAPTTTSPRHSNPRSRAWNGSS
jgi:NAD(P)H dehydrogenase (quinone)